MATLTERLRRLETGRAIADSESPTRKLIGQILGAEYSPPAASPSGWCLECECFKLSQNPWAKCRKHPD